jgi:hypothetical protein
MILYNLKREGTDAWGTKTQTYRISKFTDDMEVESSYLVDEINCECPQGHKPICRHRKMLPLMVDRVDTPWFYCFDVGLWYNISGIEEQAALVGPLALNETSPMDLHNTIAKAVGERIVRPLPPRDPQTLRRRM